MHPRNTQVFTSTLNTSILGRVPQEIRIWMVGQTSSSCLMHWWPRGSWKTWRQWAEVTAVPQLSSVLATPGHLRTSGITPVSCALVGVGILLGAPDEDMSCTGRSLEPWDRFCVGLFSQCSHPFPSSLHLLCTNWCYLREEQSSKKSC